jgi:hypothetical protein
VSNAPCHADSLDALADAWIARMLAAGWDASSEDAHPSRHKASRTAKACRKKHGQRTAKARRKNRRRAVKR